VIIVRLRTILAAAGGFLNGFLGLGALPDSRETDSRPGNDHDAVACAHLHSPTPDTVRRALAIRAAGRRNCC